MKEFIKNKLDEATIKLQEKDDSPEKEGGGGKYQKIQGLLSNEIFNHSEIIRKLWGEDDATKRSLFRKKLHRETNDEGSTYEFDDTELTKISNILMDTSSEIRKKVGKQGKG
jgi:hypothetical protein